MQIEFFSFCVTFIIGLYGNTLRWEIYEWLFRFFIEKYEPPLGWYVYAGSNYAWTTDDLHIAMFMRMVDIYLYVITCVVILISLLLKLNV